MQALPTIPLLAVLLAPLAGADDIAPTPARIETETYWGSWLSGSGSFETLPDCERNIGGACFSIQPGDANVTIALSDALSREDVCAVATMENGIDSVATYFCSMARIPVMEEASVLRVKIVLSAFNPALQGAITATFEPETAPAGP